MNLAGLLFALAVWSVPLWSVRHLATVPALVIVAASGVLMVVSIILVEDIAAWGMGSATGLVIALALHVALERRRVHRARLSG